MRQFDRTVADTTGRTWAGSARLGVRFSKGAATTFLVANDFALARTSLNRPRIVDAELVFDPEPGRASFWHAWPLQPYFAVYPSWGAGAYAGVSGGIGWQQFPQWVNDTQALAARYAFEAGYEWKRWIAGFNASAHCKHPIDGIWERGAAHGT